LAATAASYRWQAAIGIDGHTNDAWPEFPAFRICKDGGAIIRCFALRLPTSNIADS
jgi:hypothetical protein